ncbi:MAG: ferrous iron transport protein A [Treponema sp.]|nr:ferrous iron transport protein A [Treponema sp.]
MKTLSELPKDAQCILSGINGDSRFVSRITSIGLTPGCSVTVIKNEIHCERLQRCKIRLFSILPSPYRHHTSHYYDDRALDYSFPIKSLIDVFCNSSSKAFWALSNGWSRTAWILLPTGHFGLGFT